MKKTALLLWAIPAWVIFPVFAEVTIIANPDNHIPPLEKKEIKDIFTGKRTRWNGSGKIVIATPSAEYTRRDLVLAAEYSWQNQTIINYLPHVEPFEVKQEFESFYGWNWEHIIRRIENNGIITQ